MPLQLLASAAFLLSLLLTTAFASSSLAAAAPPPRLTDLFTSGTLGIHTFRVPNIVTTTNGTLVAIAQGKLGGSGDEGATSVLLRRSDTGGAAWSAPAVVLHRSRALPPSA